MLDELYDGQIEVPGAVSQPTWQPPAWRAEWVERFDPLASA